MITYGDQDRIRLRVPAIYPAPEHRDLRDAADAANVQGTVTWIENTAGVPVAAIVPVDVAKAGLKALEVRA